MKTKFIYLLAACSLFVSAAYPQQKIVLGKQLIKEAQSVVNKENAISACANIFLSNKQSDLRAEFSVKGSSSDEVIWSENFDNILTQWTFESTYPSGLYWNVRTDLTGNYSFKNVYSGDAGTLKVEAPYRYADRGNCAAISPEIITPRNAKLSFFLGCSTNFSKDCNLFLKIKKEEDTEWISLWDVNSAGLTPPNFIWRHINVDLNNYSEQKIQLQWYYEGYSGEFYLDSIAISGVKAINNIQVMTGDNIEFVDMSEGNPVNWEWSFPGGVPALSTEQTPTVYYTKDGVYDVTLSIKNETDNHSITKTGYVTVTGSSPVAKILPPATFRSFSTRFPFIAPLQGVQYQDASLNFPETREWIFTGVDPLATESYITEEENPIVNYMFRNNQGVGLTVENMHGTSTDFINVTVDYSSLISNLRPEDQLFTFDLGDGYGSFPGSNKLKMTEYAEKFSKPSTPGVIYGANVYFSSKKTTELIEQIANIRVSIHKSENGLPGEMITSESWMAFELDTGGLPTTFEFSKPVQMNDEFFIVVSGIPEYNEGCNVSFMTAKFRDKDNTAYFKQREEWKQASNYFPAGSNHTSYAIAPLLQHSVMSFFEDMPIIVKQDKDVREVEIFSIRGYQLESISDDWCRIIRQPNGMTLDTLHIEYDDLPKGIEERTAYITLTDEGLQSITVELKQIYNGSGISVSDMKESFVYPIIFNDELTVELPPDSEQINIFDISGNLVYYKSLNLKDEVLNIQTSLWNKGIYIVQINYGQEKRIVKIIKE